jgi:serine phosphatase RsbU (regulator of sigma subunit)
MVLLTDGITEALNADDDEFGYQRVVDILREHRHLPSGDLQQRLLHALDSWAVKGLQDDATLVTISLCCE